MFSMSMMASSTTTPTAMTKPARTMVLSVAPPADSTTAAAMSESGIAMTLIRAVRQSKRNRSRTATTSRTPSSRALLRLPIASSMNVAGRKIAASTSIPGKAGSRTASASSTPRVTSRVFAQGNFSTISRRPSPSLMTASPMRG